MKKLINNVSFDLSSRLPLQLGRESISNSTTAISELVKNAYDADASNVKLSFFNLTKPVSTMIIEDDGNGMSLDQLIEKWLRIGTENKTINATSLSGRVLTGAKGLGRLGIDRLCKRVILQTKSESDDSIFQIDVDWRRYESTNQSFFDIKHKIHSIPFPYSDKYGNALIAGSGTRLILIGLKDDWNGYIKDDLLKELRLLVSPFREVEDFKVELSFEGENETSLDSSDILKFARWEANANLNKDGSFLVRFKYKDELPEIEFPLNWPDWVNNRGDIPRCGPLSFKLYFIPRESTKDNQFKLKQLRNFLDANQGVRIYRDNFRVRPYGEPTGKGDWLDLGLRKVRNPEAIKDKGWKIGPNVVVGAVFISRFENQILNDQANREGIIENEAFFDMRAFVLRVIEQFEIEITSKAQSQSESSPKIELKDIKERTEKTSSEIDILKNKIEHDLSSKRLDKKKLTKLANSLFAVVEKQQKENNDVALLIDKMEKLNDTMANLASLGILTVSLGHESRQQSSMALTNIRVLRRIINEDLEIDRVKAIKKIDALDVSLKYISAFAGFALSNVKIDKRHMNKLELKSIVKSIIDVFSNSLKKSKIDIVTNWDEEESFYVKGFQMDWESTVINFLTNSMWALEERREGERTIKITLEKDNINKKIIFTFSDSGRGLEPGTEKHIFDTGFSTKKDPKGDQIGTGMGLAIVKNFVIARSSGVIEAQPTCELGGASFKITTPCLD